MNKEMLINLKEKLERKYIAIDNRGISNAITEYEIGQKENEKEALDNLENYFEALITKLSMEGKCFDKLEISAVYEVFYKENEIDEENYDLPFENARPLKDYVIISFGCYRATDGVRKYHSDPEDIYDGCYKECVVSFSKFKKLLEERGFNIGIIDSFDEIVSKVKHGDIPITFYEIQFTKDKKLIKE